MKILYVTTISNTVNAFLIPHIRFLIHEGNHVDVAFNTVQEVSQELIALGCSIYNIEFQRSPLSKENYKAYRRLKKLVVQENYDLVHTHTPVASFITRLACRKSANTRVLYTAHGFHFYNGAPKINWAFYYTMERIAARWTNGIITINEEDYLSANRLKLRAGASVYKVNGIGIDLSKFAPQTSVQKSQLRKTYGYNDSDMILLSVAELNHNKHQDLLIDAVNILKDKIPNIKLLLAGAGVLEDQYKKQVVTLGLEDNVIFLGYRKDIPDLLKITDVVVSASRREGLPVNVMEAMATSLPLAVTDCRGNRDLVRDGVNGYVVGGGDKEGFSNAIQKLCKSKELRKQFGDKSVERIMAFSLGNVLEEMRVIYEEFWDNS